MAKAQSKTKAQIRAEEALHAQRASRGRVVKRAVKKVAPKVRQIVEDLAEDDVNDLDLSSPVDLFTSFELRIEKAFDANVDARRRLKHVLEPILVDSENDACGAEGPVGDLSRLERLVSLVCDRIESSTTDLNELADRARL